MGFNLEIDIVYLHILLLKPNRYVLFDSQMYIMKKKKKIFSPFPLCSHQRPSSYSQK